MKGATRYGWLLGVAVALGLASVFVSLAREDSVVRPAAPSRDSSPPSATPAAAAHGLRPGPSRPLRAALPSEVLDSRRPLRDRIAELDRQAREGDALAACTLATELNRCANVTDMTRRAMEADARLEALAHAPPQENVELEIERGLRAQKFARDFIAQCEGVDHSRWESPARYYFRAADAGHESSMLLALMPHRYPLPLLFRDPALIGIYKTRAPAYVDSLLRQGDLRVLDLLRATLLPHGYQGSILLEALPPPYDDPAFVAALIERYHEEVGYSPPVAPPSTPSALAAITPTDAHRRLAALEFDRHFGADVRQRFEAKRRTVDVYACK